MCKRIHFLIALVPPISWKVNLMPFCLTGVNVGCGPAEERVLLTGLHAVADIYCENCKTTLGWKYEHAFESSQKYKEGKFIIELAHMIKDNGWE
uniref:Protein yippee-like 1 n=1 Tax=Sphaerodactylus townsendi TaxID=933632 RepID=A0ACB8G089_9SAUR